ncbi:MAG: helix-turn-helix transcriptional regulator [Lachnospiraceae bacterium]|nr:helix-turn-helix transcriptional regulator [Lachnospiraceae bacterium]
MPISKVGYLIKRRREELGYTQEELADGICAVTTLSRIEFLMRGVYR